MAKRKLLMAAILSAGMVSGAQAAPSQMEQSFNAAERGNFQSAVSIWQDLAESGDAQAQFNLGLMYHSGAGVDINEQEAVSLYLKAAKGGYRPAQVYLVVGYEEGWFGLPKDSSQAYYWRGLLDSEN